MKFVKAVIALSLVAASAAASAGYQDSGIGPYVAIDAGVSSQAGVDVVASDQAAVGVTIGYNFDRTIGAELSFQDFDRRQLPAGGLGVVSWKSKATSIAAVGRMELSREFDLFAKAGIASTSLNVTNGQASASVSNTGVLVGIGAEYRFDRNWSVRGGLDLYPDFGGSAETMSTATIGVKYRF